MSRVFFHVQHLLGIGHIRRAAVLARSLAASGFDVIVNLVSLGLGVSLVPHRVLPLYEQRRTVRRLALQPRFSRDLTVVIRRNRQPPEPLRAFVASVLF